MKRDEDNEDYKAGHLFVFEDSLELDSQLKHMIEASSLDFLPNDIKSFATSAHSFALTAEKKVKPDGSRYVLVRKATA